MTKYIIPSRLSAILCPPFKEYVFMTTGIISKRQHFKKKYGSHVNLPLLVKRADFMANYPY